MNTNENIHNDTSEDIIDLGVASTETQGPGTPGEINGGEVSSGISDE